MNNQQICSIIKTIIGKTYKVLDEDNNIHEIEIDKFILKIKNEPLFLNSKENIHYEIRIYTESNFYIVKKIENIYDWIENKIDYETSFMLKNNHRPKLGIIKKDGKIY